MGHAGAGESAPRPPLGQGRACYTVRAMYSIVLVDDHAIVREGFKRLIEMEPDLEVVAECRSADDAVESGSGDGRIR